MSRRNHNTVIKEFTSIAKFEEYINETPLNNLFRWEKLASTDYESGFNQTRSFPEALELLKHGWDNMAKKLETTLKLQANQEDTKKVVRSHFDVAGFQASVPRYLQGIPTSMVNQKKVQQKQKVITIVKHVGYLGNISANTIVENSIKALQIVKKIEALGYRVNLDVMSPAMASSDNETAVVRVRVKAAAERLNIAKVAFPLVHPDMLRRMVFRFREVCPELKDTSWKHGYGATIYDRSVVKSFLHEGEYYLHNFIGSVDDEIEAMKLK